MISLAMNTRQPILPRPKQLIHNMEALNNSAQMTVNGNQISCRLSMGSVENSNHEKLVRNDMQNISNRVNPNSIQMRTQVLKLLEDLESNINNDYFGKSTKQLISEINTYLKDFGSYLDEDLNFSEQIDVYFNLLRNILRNTKLDRLSRALVLEIIELRASNWVYSDEIGTYYRNKVTELESEDNYSSSPEMNRGIKSSQSSGSIISSSITNDVIKSSGKFTKVTKIPGKIFLKDEVVIRNCDSGKVNPGVKERTVQISGQTEENIERAKELIETTIKRNASPVPFECPPKSFDLSFNQINEDVMENNIYERTNTATRNDMISDYKHKMPFSFVIDVNEQQIVVLTKDFRIGEKAKKILEKYLALPLESSDSSSDNSDENNVASNVMSALQKQTSISKVDSFVGNQSVLLRSVSQGNVPIGRTSMRYINRSDELGLGSNPKKTLITYNRDLLMDLAKSPLSQTKPTIITEIAIKWPEIVSNYDRNQIQANSRVSPSYTETNPCEQW